MARLLGVALLFLALAACAPKTEQELKWERDQRHEFHVGEGIGVLAGMALAAAWSQRRHRGKPAPSTESDPLVVDGKWLWRRVLAGLFAGAAGALAGLIVAPLVSPRDILTSQPVGAVRDGVGLVFLVLLGPVALLALLGTRIALGRSARRRETMPAWAEEGIATAVTLAVMGVILVFSLSVWSG